MICENYETYFARIRLHLPRYRNFYFLCNSVTFRIFLVLHYPIALWCTFSELSQSHIWSCIFKWCQSRFRFLELESSSSNVHFFEIFVEICVSPFHFIASLHMENVIISHIISEHTDLFWRNLKNLWISRNLKNLWIYGEANFDPDLIIFFSYLFVTVNKKTFSEVVYITICINPWT